MLFVAVDIFVEHQAIIVYSVDIVIVIVGYMGFCQKVYEFDTYSLQDRNAIRNADVLELNAVLLEDLSTDLLILLYSHIADPNLIC